MQLFFKVVFFTVWYSLGFIFIFLSLLYSDGFLLAAFAVWFAITAIALLVKWIKYRKENPPPTKEQKQRLKQWEKERKYRNSEEFKKKYISEVEIENSYFGNGVFVKDSSGETIGYIDIKSGFDRMFDSFGKKSDSPYDLYEFIVREDNIEYVLASLEKIYRKADQIMEECYDKMYNEIIEFFENITDGDKRLKDEFDMAYLKENWYINGMSVDDDRAEFSLGINAAKDPEDDSNYVIIIFVDYDTQEPEVSFEVVW